MRRGRPADDAPMLAERRSTLGTAGPTVAEEYAAQRTVAMQAVRGVITVDEAATILAMLDIDRRIEVGE